MPTIILHYCDIASQWQAWFDGAPCVCYGGEFSMQAVRRLLDGDGVPTGEVELRVDRIGSDPLVRMAPTPAASFTLLFGSGTV